jgi:hypothetical protein
MTTVTTFLYSELLPTHRGTVRWLSANGHPGYGKQFAADAGRYLDRNPGRSVWDAVKDTLHNL